MSESRKHVELVKIAVDYIIDVVSPELRPQVQYDSADTKRPPMIKGNYIPDVYFWNKDLLILGEAKTIDDFERPHSKNQFESYLEECEAFFGHAILVVSIPWQLVPTAKNYFRKLKHEKGWGTPVVIVNEIGRRFEV
jgi:hypothetical protein